MNKLNHNHVSQMQHTQTPQYWNFYSMHQQTSWLPLRPCQQNLWHLVWRIHHPVNRYDSWSYVFRGTTSHHTCEQVWWLMIPVNRYNSSSYLWTRMTAHRTCEQVWQLVIPVHRHNISSYLWTGRTAHHTCEQVWRWTGEAWWSVHTWYGARPASRLAQQWMLL